MAGQHSLPDGFHKDVVGYCTPWSLRAGEAVSFKLSRYAEGDINAQIVQLISGDDRPHGTGLLERNIAASVNGPVQVLHQPLVMGSYARIEGVPAIAAGQLELFCYPTLLPASQRQTLMKFANLTVAVSDSGFYAQWQDNDIHLPQVVQDANQVGKREEADLRAALQAEMLADQQRRFSLRQVREIPQVRALAPQLELDAVQFATGSAAIRPEQARSLARIGRALSDLIAKDPRTVILVEGHTDAVGNATYNLALSDRRAETVALALTEYFDVPPQNMITQGYGESDLKVRTLEDEPANRRAVVRNITGLLR